MENQVCVKPEIFSQYPELMCGVTTRSFFSQTFSEGIDREKPDAREKAMLESGIFFGFEKIAFSQQTHSDRVAVIESDGFIGEADALVTRQKNLALVIKTADCGQIFLFDPVAEIVGAVHAGWKGHSLRILEKTVSSMINLGAKAERLLCFIGPSIEARNYEVGADGVAILP
ncbi:MAG TPA: polyphenol oxidase family protein [Candidatus Absconditabacterales bacterium]|nr:polyphenol oxidase family protein [Candidatus Absconditabacterales bacterium]